MGFTKDSKNGFQVDLSLVFSVVSLDKLIEDASLYYDANIVVQDPSVPPSSVDHSYLVNDFYLYKVSMDKASSSADGDIGDMSINIKRIGNYKSMQDIMIEAKTTTIFQNMSEADLFLRAMLKSNPKAEKSEAFVALTEEIKGNFD